MKNTVLKTIVTTIFIIATLYLQAQIPGPGDPGAPGGGGGASVPLDGGFLMSLLAVGGILSVFLKKKKKEE